MKNAPVKIAACMITRNSIGVIDPAIESIRYWVDELNVFDTGSDDGTVEHLRELGQQTELVLCKSCGQPYEKIEPSELPAIKPSCECEGAETQAIPLAPIRVEVAGDDIPLEKTGMLGDFSWARERSLDMCSDDVTWFTWLDDDDTVVGAENYRKLAAECHPSQDGYMVYYDYARDDHGNSVCELWRERLIRLDRANWEWRNPIHEVWLPKGERQVNYTILPKEVCRYIHRKPPNPRYTDSRNIDVLESMIKRDWEAGREQDLRTVIYMGTELMARMRFAEAVPWLQKYLSDPRCGPGPERSQAYHKLAVCFHQHGNIRAALDVEWLGFREDESWSEFLAGFAEHYAAIGEWDKVRHWAKRAMEEGQPGTTLIVNPLDFTLIPMIRMAQACSELGSHEEAIQWAQRAQGLAPANEYVQALLPAIHNRATIEKTVEAALHLCTMLRRHDETLKAQQLMESLPYQVSEHPAIVSARAITNEVVRHITHPEEYREWYSTDDDMETGVSDEVAEAEVGWRFERGLFTVEVCERFEHEHARKPRVLDLGCSDFWLGMLLWDKCRVHVDGVDLNQAQIARGRERIEKHKLPGEIFEAEIIDFCTGGWDSDECYDIVSCYEVLEHVEDPELLLAAIESVTDPDGSVLISTPNGAYDGGNSSYWQHVEPHEHVRAIQSGELTRMLGERGRLEDFRIHNADRTSWAAYRPKKKKGRIAIYDAQQAEGWNPTSINTGGLGGSETALSILGMMLAERDWYTEVFTNIDEPGNYGQAFFRPTGAFDPSADYDAVVVSRYPPAFDVLLHAPTKVFWAHDHEYPRQFTPRRIQNMTDVVCVGDWQAERFARIYPDLADKLRVIRNGVWLDRVNPARGFKKRKPRVIFSSSPDRGLDHLLQMWPKIRELVPDAELHVFYGWVVFDKIAAMSQHHFEFKRAIFSTVEALGGEAGGIYMRGRIGQQDLYKEMQHARVWGYPTRFLEVSCISAMEAMCNGLPIVTSDLGALKYTVGEHGILLPVDYDEATDKVDFPDAYQANFISNVAALLSDEASWRKAAQKARAGTAELDWNLRIDEWEQLIASRVKGA